MNVLVGLAILAAVILAAAVIGMEHFPTKQQDWAKHTGATAFVAIVVLLFVGAASSTVFWVTFLVIVGVTAVVYFVLLQRKPKSDYRYYNRS